MSKIEIIHGDCLPAMQAMPDKAFDLAIVDPPYGIFTKEGTFAWKKEGTGGTWASKYGKKIKQWDSLPDDNYFNELKRVTKNQIIFGANHFSYSFLNYIVWRKLTISEKFSMGMCELASVSIKGNPKIFECAPQDKNRFHPTQKPVALYKWLLTRYAKNGDKILDTHLGSGSIAIACHDYGFDFVGYEIDEDYFKAAKERLERHQRQESFDFGQST